MPKTAAATRTELTARGLNPTSNANPQHVTVVLSFRGRLYTPEDIFDALETKYGAGKVTTDKDSLGRGNLQFTIKP